METQKVKWYREHLDDSLETLIHEDNILNFDAQCVRKKSNISKSYDIYKFDINYLGDLIIIQEVNLRRLIVTALSKQSFQQLKFSEILPLEASKVLNSALCVVIRYKRLYDLFFRAATVRQIGTELFSKDRWFLEHVKSDLKRQYELPSVEQLETIVKYSLDIPFCLNIMFGINGLKQFDTEGRELESIRKDPSFNNANHLAYLKEILHIDD
jgi:hypothetical protein